MCTYLSKGRGAYSALLHVSFRIIALYYNRKSLLDCSGRYLLVRVERIFPKNNNVYVFPSLYLTFIAILRLNFGCTAESNKMYYKNWKAFFMATDTGRLFHFYDKTCNCVATFQFFTSCITNPKFYWGWVVTNIHYIECFALRTDICIYMHFEG